MDTCQQQFSSPFPQSYHAPDGTRTLAARTVLQGRNWGPRASSASEEVPLEGSQSPFRPCVPGLRPTIRGS